jgi:hypothetical protein
MEASPTYKFARNPQAAIRTAVLRHASEISENPRTAFKAICQACNVDPNQHAFDLESFTLVFKQLGTGIQLTPDDLRFAWPELAVEAATINSETYKLFY